MWMHVCREPGSLGTPRGDSQSSKQEAPVDIWEEPRRKEWTTQPIASGDPGDVSADDGEKKKVESSGCRHEMKMTVQVHENGKGIGVKLMRKVTVNFAVTLRTRTSRL